MVTSVAGVVGMIGTALAQPKGNELMLGFSLMSGGGVVTFALAELSEPPTGPLPETETQKLRRWAKILTERAGGAAREGKCPRVRRLEKRVNLYDREVHDFVFMRDAAIVRCLDGVPAGPPAEAADGSTRPLKLPATAPDPVPAVESAPPAPSDASPPPLILPPARDPSAPPLILPPPRSLP
jgi:hypothetical protein